MINLLGEDSQSNLAGSIEDPIGNAVIPNPEDTFMPELSKLPKFKLALAVCCLMPKKHEAGDCRLSYLSKLIYPDAQYLPLFQEILKQVKEDEPDTHIYTTLFIILFQRPLILKRKVEYI